MRYIDSDEIERLLGDDEWSDWEREAREAREELEQLDAKGRKLRIKAKRPDWSLLGRVFGAVSYGKCWYCESKELRSDSPIDHFRPKNRVHGSDHEGYWWLAFDWRNYRYACTYCNSFRRTERTRGGKGDRFPLLDEARRARTPDAPLREERPLLLDPTDPEDPRFLFFDEKGRAVPGVSKSEDEVAHLRGVESIETYHLNTPQIRMARQRRMQEVQKRLSEALDLYEKKVQGDAVAEAAFKQCFRDLLLWKDPKEPFSAAALAEIRRRQDNPLAQKVLYG